MSPLPCPLAHAARTFGEAISVSSSAGKLTYSQLDEAVSERTDWLRRAGIVRGNRLAIKATADIELIVTLWALMRGGVTVCLVNPAWPPAVVDEALRVVAINRCFDLEALLGDRVIGDSLQISAPPSAAHVSASPATIIFSSGSTGTPKAIAHELSAHLASAEGANRNLLLTRRDAWLLSLPLHHVSGLGILFRCTLAGATVIVPSNEQSLEDQLREFRPTHLSLVPTQLIRLLDQFDRAPESLRVVLLGGAPLPTDAVARACREGWPLATTYGLSEMASQVTATGVNSTDEDLRTAGYVLANREVKIADDQQILVRGATLFRGYVQGDSITCPTDEDGWFATGDLGKWDSRHRLVVIGRRDNLFISGGENIYPEEIELALLDVPGIAQAIVVPITDREFGQRPLAFVDGDHQRVAAWRAALAERLPRFKIPDRFLAWPVQSGLKPDRRELRRLAESMPARE